MNGEPLVNSSMASASFLFHNFRKDIWAGAVAGKGWLNGMCKETMSNNANVVSTRTRLHDKFPRNMYL